MLLVAHAAVANSTPAAAAPVAVTASISEPELLLLALAVETTEFDVLVPALRSGRIVRIPLGELCRALNIAVEVDAERGIAEGFVFSEERRFRLDLAARQVQVANQVLALDSTAVERRKEDLYVDPALLGAWLPFGCAVNLPAATLVITPREPLPFLARLQRERRGQLVMAQAGPRIEYPRLRMPYRAWSVPGVDQSLQAITLQRSGRRSTQWQSSTFAAADVLWMEGDLLVLANDANGFTDVRGGLGRKDPDPVLLGPLRAREFRGGEVAYPGLSLIAAPAAGTGLVVSSYPLERPDQFDQHSFRGRLPPGWDVELYRDDALIGYQGSSANETYGFESVPLGFGLNEFRLVFHGPHGEHSEERHSFNVGSALTPPGRFDYRVVGGDPEAMARRAHVEGSYGLAPGVASTLALSRVDLEERTHDYAMAGLRGFRQRVFARLDGALDVRGGGILEGALETRFAGVGATLRHAMLNDFQSDLFRSVPAPILSRSGARLDAVAKVVGPVRLPIDAEWYADRLAGGGSVQTLNQRVSFASRWIAVTHSVRRVVTQLGQGASTESRNTLLASGRARRWWLRGVLEYVPGGREPWRTVQLNAETQLRGATFSVGIERYPTMPDTRVFVGLHRGEGALGWTLRTGHSRLNGAEAMLAMNFGLSREPRSGRWRTDAQPVGERGAASVQVFLDANGNNVRDVGEEPLEKVSLFVDRNLSLVSTESNGLAFVTRLASGRLVDLSIDSTSLADPLWSATYPGLSLVPRPGSPAVVDFPVVACGEVSGTIYRGFGPASRPLPGVTVELVEEKSGRVTKRATSAYDGFYDLAGARPGRYRLQIAAAQLTRFGLYLGPTRAIEFKPEGTILDGVNLILPESSGIADAP